MYRFAVVRRSVAGAVMAMGCAAMAFGGTVNSTATSFSLGLNSVSFSSGVTQFDPSLGTLTGVTLIVSKQDISQTDHVNNSGAGTRSMTGTFHYFADVNIGPYSGPALIDVGSYGVSCVGSGTEFQNCDQANTYHDTPGNLTVGIAPPSLASFIGVGMVSVGVTPHALASVLSSVPNNTGAAFFDDLSMKGTIQLLYTYDAPGVPTPEPGTYAMLGTGLGLLALKLRRK